MEEKSVRDFIPDGGTQLCEVASSLREGISCHLGHPRTGGFNVVFEVIFEDQVRWIARIPLFEHCYQPEEITLSYAATLKYIKMHTTIPVPQVYGYAAKSGHGNATGVSYILMEYLDGQSLPELDRVDLEPTGDDLALVKKVYQQLSDIILQLATLKFEKIGSLREDPDGNFFVTSFADPNTAYPKERASAYKKLAKDRQGPFSSVLDFYDAMSDLNDLSTTEETESEDEDEDEEDKEMAVSQFKQLRAMASAFVVDGFHNGPFVINHDDLTLQNILVDEDFNLTGIIDFPGTVVPVSSLCVFPWLFRDNLSGLMTDRDLYLEVFLNRDTPDVSSALASKPVREKLMQTAVMRQDFELGLMKPYAALVVPRLLKHVYGTEDVEGVVE